MTQIIGKVKINFFSNKNFRCSVLMCNSIFPSYIPNKLKGMAWCLPLLIHVRLATPCINPNYQPSLKTCSYKSQEQKRYVPHITWGDESALNHSITLVCHIILKRFYFKHLSMWIHLVMNQSMTVNIWGEFV